MVRTCYQFTISPMIPNVRASSRQMQIVLIAVMAEGSLLMEMKFLKSFRFLKSSVSVLPPY